MFQTNATPPSTGEMPRSWPSATSFGGFSARADALGRCSHDARTALHGRSAGDLEGLVRPDLYLLDLRRSEHRSQHPEDPRNERPIDMTQATHLHPRAEVVGYPEPVLEAIRELVAEIQLDPELALGAGLAIAEMKDVFAVERDGRQSLLTSKIADLLTVAAEIALEEKGSEDE